MRAVVLVNSDLGSLRGRHRGALVQLEALFREASVVASVRRVPGARLCEQAVAAAQSGADAVVAAGGDGTISSVAAGLVDSPVPLGVIALGTFNHFARDIGAPLALGPAIEAIATGSVRQVDVGEVNARTFINNASIGAYPAMVLDRSLQQMKFGHSKWRAMLGASWRVLRRLPLLEVRLALDADAPWYETPCVFVGNNRYRFDLFAPGTRPALDHGRLSVHVARATTRLAVLRLGLEAALGKLDHDADWISTELEEFWIECRRSQVRVGIDGEVRHLAAPLHFRIRPRALRVIVPG